MNEETALMNPMMANAPVVAQPKTGLIAIEQQRAVAEVQARMMIARSNPRDQVACVDRILQDCMRPSLAEAAVYQYNRGGTDITGPSIRLAEAIARQWGNIASGIKELSRHNGYSECVSYAWDLETGYYDERQFQVKHWRDTRKGGYAITDERDIYELVANMGQRRKRAVLLSVIPGDIVEAAVRQCEVTLKTKAEVTPERLKSLVEKFAEYSVTQAQLEQRIGRHLDAMTPALMVQLGKIYNSLRDGMSQAADWFEVTPAAEGSAEPTPKSGNEAVKSALKKKAAPELQSLEGALAKLDTFEDLDRMGDYATGLSDEIRNDERFAKAFAARMKAIKER